MERELEIPPAELVEVEKLRVDGNNPNKMGARRFEALKKSIKIEWKSTRVSIED
jgi:hypothetical protein